MSYAVPRTPPSFGILAVATAVYGATFLRQPRGRRAAAAANAA
jgi:zinc/manganese transport system permease protein